MIAGLIICGIAIANMVFTVNSIIQPIRDFNIPFLQPSNEDMILGYSGTALAAAFYLFFLYYCMHGSIMFCKIPRKTLTSTYITTTMMPVSLSTLNNNPIENYKC